MLFSNLNHRISQNYPRVVFGLFLITSALLAFWKLPFAPVVAVAAAILLGVGLYFGRWAELGRLLVRLPAFYWVFFVLYFYWILNLLFIARIPISVWLTPDFLINDGKIFLAFAPILIVPLVFHKVKKYTPNTGILVLLVTALLVTTIGVIQYWVNIEIPSLSQRQQFVLLGGVMDRAFIGGLLQQNAAAAFLLFPFAYSVLRFILNTKKWWYGIISVIFLAGVILTISRSAMIGLSVGLLALITLLAMKVWQGSRWRKVSIWLVTILITNIALYSATQFIPAFKSKIFEVQSPTVEELANYGQSNESLQDLDLATSTNSATTEPNAINGNPLSNETGADEPNADEDRIQGENLPENNVTDRILLWKKALRDITMAPIFGIGMSRYNDLDVDYHQLMPGVVIADGGQYINAENHAHNSWLHWLAETGIVGLVLMGLFWLLVIWFAYQRLTKSKSIAAASFHIAVIGSLFGLFAASLFEHNMAAPSVMFMYSFVIGFYSLPNDRTMGFDDGSDHDDDEKNILWLNHRSALGGGEKVLLSYLKFSKINRDRVRVVLFEEGDLVESLKADGYQVKVMNPGGEFVSVARHDAGLGNWLGQTKSLISLVFGLVKYIKSENIGLIIGNSTKADMMAVLAGRACRRPVAVRLHDTVEVGEFNRKTYILLKLFFVLGVDYFMPVSNAVDRSLDKIGVARDRRQVIYNGIPFQKNDLKTKSKSVIAKYQGEKVVILSRLIRHKGQHVVIKLWPRILMKYPQAKLFLIGGGLFDNEGYDKYLEQMVANLDLKNSVIFTGFVNDVDSILQDADVLIQPSLSPDSLPTALIEAISKGVYVIASDNGGAKEIIVDEDLGTVYEPEDSEALERSLLQALAKKPSTHKVPASSSLFAKTFSLSAYVLAMDAVVSRLIAYDFVSDPESVYTDKK